MVGAEIDDVRLKVWNDDEMMGLSFVHAKRMLTGADPRRHRAPVGEILADRIVGGFGTAILAHRPPIDLVAATDGAIRAGGGEPVSVLWREGNEADASGGGHGHSHSPLRPAGFTPGQGRRP